MEPKEQKVLKKIIAFLLALLVLFLSYLMLKESNFRTFKKSYSYESYHS